MGEDVYLAPEFLAGRLIDRALGDQRVLRGRLFDRLPPQDAAVVIGDVDASSVGHGIPPEFSGFMQDDARAWPASLPS